MSPSQSAAGTYVALSGGSGGVKLAVGLAQLLRERLTVVVNTGDDFEHLGLHISPDVDTVLYTLAGLVNDETGWGRRDETWTFMRALGALGGPTWFKLGDGDLATHVDRTCRLRAGETLTGIAAKQAAALGIAARILPMTDDAVRTVVETDAGTLALPGVLRARPMPAGGARHPLRWHRQRRSLQVRCSRLCRRQTLPASSSARRTRGSASIRSWPCPACAMHSRPAARRSSRCRPSSPARR